MIIGVLGGGQLGRMLGLAGIPLGFSFRFLDPAEHAPAAAVGEHFRYDFSDPEGLKKFSDGVDLITYEFENVPAAALKQLASSAPIHPSIKALSISQDRIEEKNLFSKLGIPTPRFCEINSESDLVKEFEKGFPLPAVLKTRRLGYDGKGQYIIKEIDQIHTACAVLGGSDLVIEEFIPFDAEVSLLSVAGAHGEISFYPLIENVHRRGILETSVVPNKFSSLQTLAEKAARQIIEETDYRGVLTVEFFIKNGVLLANEMAPRVHNSGHWSIEGSETSQFENHLRAISGLPLGSTALRGHVALLNLVGEHPSSEKILTLAGAHLHLYGKSPRIRRKIGHITALSNSAAGLTTLLAELKIIVESSQQYDLGA